MSHHTARSLGTGTANLPLTVAVLVEGKRLLGEVSLVQGACGLHRDMSTLLTLLAVWSHARARARACLRAMRICFAGTSSEVSLLITAPRRQRLASCRLSIYYGHVGHPR